MNAIVESSGAMMLKVLLQQIRQLAKPWEQTPAREQEQVIFHLRNAVEVAMKHAVARISSADIKAIAANVDQVVFKDGIKAVLTLAADQEGRHQLADSHGKAVMIVMASAEEHLEGMERIAADPDQRDMIDEAISEEQRASRMESWEKLIASLDEPLAPAGEDAPPKSMGQQCQELLAAVYVVLPVEVCEGWTEQECCVAAFWAIEYAKGKDTPARPHWLPVPQPPNGHTEGDGRDDIRLADDDSEGDDDAEVGGDEPDSEGGEE